MPEMGSMAGNPRRSWSDSAKFADARAVRNLSAKSSPFGNHKKSIVQRQKYRNYNLYELFVDAGRSWTRLFVFALAHARQLRNVKQKIQGKQLRNVKKKSQGRKLRNM